MSARRAGCDSGAGRLTGKANDMSQDTNKIEHHRVEETVDPQSHMFMIAAGTLMVVEILFGLLNSMNIIHM